MNFAGVSLYVLAKTHSTVQVSFTVILLTLRDSWYRRSAAC